MSPFLCLYLLLENKVRRHVQQRRVWIPYTRDPRPGLVPLVIICVIIPALGYQSSRTGVTEFDGKVCVCGKGGEAVNGVVAQLLGSISKVVTTWARPPAAEDMSVNNGIEKNSEAETVFERFESFISVKIVWASPFRLNFQRNTSRRLMRLCFDKSDIPWKPPPPPSKKKKTQQELPESVMSAPAFIFSQRRSFCSVLQNHSG